MTEDIGKRPVWLLPGAPPRFPDPRDFAPHGLIAGGGDLAPERLAAAYRAGIFPWYDEEPIMWWSPDPRAILEEKNLHISRSLGRTLRRATQSGELRVSVDEDLLGVMRGCAERPEGTWLNEHMKLAYRALAGRGYVHSYEVWQGENLVGGIYGVCFGSVFAGESMFHRQTDASKVALVSAATHLFAAGVQLFDVQFLTDHLASMGVVEIPRNAYLDRLAAARRQPLAWPQKLHESSMLPWVVERLGLATP